MSKSQRPEHARTTEEARESAHLEKLERAVEVALRQELPARELLPLLRQLARHASLDTVLGCSARLMLAETLLRGEPTRKAAWHAARFAKEARTSAPIGPARARCWGASGLAYTILGYYRSARFAYFQALKEDPGDPVCAHNLGHLLDVKLGESRAALPWLVRAYRALPNEREVAASYAYALVRLGQRSRAVDVLSAPLGSRDDARALVEEWAEQRPS